MKTVKALLFSCLLITLSGCGSKKDNQTLTVGVSADYPPFEFNQNGQVAGFDIDLIQAIAKKMHKQVSFVDMSFHSLIPSLKSGKIDMAISSITQTPYRTKNIDFSNSYYSAKVAMLTLKKSPITAKVDLTGKKIGVQLGTTFESFAKEIPEATILARVSNPVLVEELKLGRVDAVIVEHVQAIAFQKNIPALKYQIIGKTNEGYAIALKKKSALTKPLNDILATLEQEHLLEKLMHKWLGV